MGAELHKSLEWRPHDWVVTEAIPDVTTQCLAQLSLADDPTNQKDLQFAFLTPHHIEEGNIQLTRTYWYDLRSLSSGAYFAKSTQHPRNPVQGWLKVEDHRVVKLSESRQDVFRWFGVSNQIVPFRCGHCCPMDVYGPPERAREAFRRYTGWDCTDCYRTAKFLAAQATSEKLSLPPLFGTRRQVEWATQIRSKIVEELMAWEQYWEEFLGNLEQHHIHDDGYVVGQLKQIESSTFWIEHKELNLFQILQIVDQEMW
jgi:hypothetical protein